MLRPFDRTKDRDAARRIWREIGWLEAGDAKAEAADRWMDAGTALVAEVNGEAECLVCTCPGRFDYLTEELPVCCVTGVTTSRIARKSGYALRLTARAIAADAQEGAAVAALGMFEQGFYNRIGFGSGAYEIWVGFDPAQLKLDQGRRYRTPDRICASDWEAVHRARLNRPRRHGQVTCCAAISTRGPMESNSDGFGLGYRSSAGEISHHFWCAPKGEHGPYRIRWMVYHTRDQFLELMALIKSLGDQVRLVKMQEPSAIQLQDMMQQPFKQMGVTSKSDYAAYIDAKAVYQYRICNVQECIAHAHLGPEEVRFNLELTDPIEQYLDEHSAWRGIGGTYIVSLGSSSHAEQGADDTLPTLTSSVGAFTRMWMGVRPASGLAITDEFDGPQDLLDKLDSVLRLPRPVNDWDF